jgi:hypothetical protein
MAAERRIPEATEAAVRALRNASLTLNDSDEGEAARAIRARLANACGVSDGFVDAHSSP